MGAIAGGAAGNAIGKGNGRVAATALGVIGGAVLGNQIEGSGRPQYETVQRCTGVSGFLCGRLLNPSLNREAVW